MSKIFGIGNRPRCNTVEIVHYPLRAAAIHLSGKRFATTAVGTQSDSVDYLSHFRSRTAAAVRARLLELRALCGNGLVEKSDADCHYKNRRVDLLHCISLFAVSRCKVRSSSLGQKRRYH